MTAASLLIIALGGAVGGIARVWLADRVSRILGDAFPWGILLVNATGAAALGILAAGLPAPGDGGVSMLWLALAVGILGSFTTVSSFSLQALDLVRSGARGRATAYVAASLVVCIGAAAVGYASAGLWLVQA